MATVKIKWDHFGPVADNFKIYRSIEPFTPGVLPTPIGEVVGTAREFNDTGAALNQDYFYKVSSQRGVVTRVSAELAVSTHSDGDPYWANVVALLHFNGANGSTTFTDEKAGVWTRGGSAIISTENSRFGGSSLKLDGASYLTQAASAKFGFGTGDFTVECFMASTAIERVIFDVRDAGTQSGVFISNHPAKGNGIAYYQPSSGNLGGTTPTNTGDWFHYAWCGEAGTLRMFVNGNRVSQTAVALNFGASRPGWIGSQFGGAAARYSGFIDEFRVTKGVARYKENFIPPSEPFPNY